MKLSIKTEFLWISSDLLLNYYTFLNAYILSKLTGLMKVKKTYVSLQHSETVSILQEKYFFLKLSNDDQNNDEYDDDKLFL